MPTLIDADVLSDALSANSLAGWEGTTEQINLLVTGLTEEQSQDLLAHVQASAGAMDHHPSIERPGGATRFVLSTHSAGGVTELDVTLASMINGYVRKVRGIAPDPLPEVAPLPSDMVDRATEEGVSEQDREHDVVDQNEVHVRGLGLVTGSAGTPSGFASSDHAFEPRQGLQPGQDPDDLR